VLLSCQKLPWLALAALLLLAVFVLIGTYIYLPPLVERSVARSVQDRLELKEKPDVEVESDLPPEILVGRFSGGSISLGGADFGGLRAEKVALDLNPFDLDVLRSLARGALTAEEPLSGTLGATLSEREVLRLVQAGADVPVRDLRLEEGRVVVGSETTVFGMQVPISVQGGLLLRGESLVFEPRSVSALGAEVPPELADRVLEGTDLSYQLEGLPSGSEISGVEVAENRLILSGEMERIPLGEPAGG
jgi:LmeA-like phospholipid-binding